VDSLGRQEVRYFIMLADIVLIPFLLGELTRGLFFSAKIRIVHLSSFSLQRKELEEKEKR